MSQLVDSLQLFSKNEYGLLLEGLHGLEQESLRIDAQGFLASSKHPPFLGSPLFHPSFSLDFGQSQLELITKAHPSFQDALGELNTLKSYVYQGLGEEGLWPLSTPCPLFEGQKIKLAHFGYTPAGYQKWLYRKGLSVRYGKAMQLMSGVHYSFSFSSSFWKFYHRVTQSKSSLKAFISDQYLHVVRYFLRVGWICSYLFGASPMLHSSYHPSLEKGIKMGREKDYYFPHATSLRMSPLGYYSKIQSQNAISFNSMQEYLEGLKFMLNTPAQIFEQIGVFRDEKQIQMNANILQIEAEHYTRIRPKANPQLEQRPFKALEKGIHYLETRILDLCPYSKAGVSEESLYLIHLLLVGGLLSPSPLISKEEQKSICENQRQVALFGREKNLKLLDHQAQKNRTLKEWATEILESLMPLAQLFDSQISASLSRGYEATLKKELEKIKDPSLTPSARVLEELLSSNNSYHQIGLELARKRSEAFKETPLSTLQKQEYALSCQRSLEILKEQEERYDDVFIGYEDLEYSTQILLKEAQKRGVDFEFLDRSQNFVQLKKNEKTAWVKQATITSLDSMISYFMMEHKEATKKILKQAGLKVAEGKMYSSLKEALDEYDETQELVVKPNHTNMGVGIHFIAKKSPLQFKKALENAFKLDSHVLVEKRAQGDEHRFLVIQNKVVAICKRVPPHVIGDGKSTLLELVEAKNKKNAFRKKFQKPIPKKAFETACLREQGLNWHSILPRGKQAFFRWNSNVSTGGESIDQTDAIDPYFKQVAIEAARSLGVQVCGVDLFIDPQQKSYTLIELNFNPALYLHRYPSEGEKRYVEKDVLDALGF